MINNKDDMRELIDKLNSATKMYDLGSPIMSDKEWDDLYFELAEAEKKFGYTYPDSPTQKVIFSSVSKLSKKTHNHPMLSLDKTKDIEVFRAFIEKAPCVLMPKLDGLSVSLTYEDGILISAETRGNGLVGEDVTHNARVIKNIPQKIPYKEKVVIDGEVICDLKTFNERFKNIYKNPRNYAAGALRRLDPDPDNGLSFVAWDWPNSLFVETFYQKLFELSHWGFEFVVLILVSPNKTDLDNAIFHIKYIANELNYPIDGVVAKYNDINYYNSLGATEHHFRGGFAYKFYDEEYETTLKNIVYDVSRLGVLTPVAVFEPVDTGDSIVERASLHNISVMKEILGDTPYYGQPLTVIKANMIIPQITKATKKNYGDIIAQGGVTVGLGGDYGILCPICGGLTSVHVSDSGVETLRCDNENCPGKLAQQIDHYCSKKGMDIKGISRATIEKLIDWGWVESIKDIYFLHAHQMEWMDQPGFGKASVFKILDAIDNSRENVDLASFIAALGIPLVGKAIAKELCKYYSTWEEFYAAVGGDWSEFDGIGPEISKAINNFDFTEANRIATTLLNFKDAATQSSEELDKTSAIKDKTFCVTGKLNNYTRDSIKSEIESLGGKVVGSISSKVNYLITNTPDSGTSKNKDAQRLGIPIITEDEYIKMKG